MTRKYDLAIVLNYYYPYVSGLTVTARLVAEGLAARGHRVVVVCAQHDRKVPLRETVNGVDVVRCPVVLGISRGVVSPSLPWVAARIARESAVVNLHLPMLEAGLIARLAGGATPVLSTYHVDLWLPAGLVNRVAVAAVDVSSRTALRRSAAVVVNSLDQARYSKLAPLLERGDLRPIPAPCLDRTGGTPRFRDGAGMHVGFMGRIVEEKGIDVLLRAFRRIDDPAARLLIAGDHVNVAGGSVLSRLRAAIDADPRVRVLGHLRDDEIADFYASIDVFSLPSTVESFGIVQAEAMITGVPPVASNLPGGRYPVQAMGFGALTEPRDDVAIAEALPRLARIGAEERADASARALAAFGIESCLDSYEKAMADVRVVREVTA
ncbi:glycosyltransferase family 4 protein [Lentzea sp. NPDC092896]|uniref:glycosyltransferase family 4 protein n=1 Tax=Lentzea sp. NPDC092896 TaxID=3364127 RepID=UPI00380061BB